MEWLVGQMERDMLLTDREAEGDNQRSVSSRASQSSRPSDAASPRNPPAAATTAAATAAAAAAPRRAPMQHIARWREARRLDVAVQAKVRPGCGGTGQPDTEVANVATKDYHAASRDVHAQELGGANGPYDY